MDGTITIPNYGNATTETFHTDQKAFQKFNKGSHVACTDND